MWTSFTLIASGGLFLIFGGDRVVHMWTYMDPARLQRL